MEKLSIIIFSRNHAGKVVKLIKEHYDAADEIILMDSSDDENQEILHKSKKSLKLKKLKIFHVVALGYPDPLRMYGLKKCSNRWVFLLDTDESLSADLKKDLRKIISATEYDALAIYRHDKVEGSLRRWHTWQTRLFKKDKIEYRGTRHEQAIVHGKLGRLEDPRYIINHVVDPVGTQAQSEQLAPYDTRLSYKLYNRLMGDNLTKFSASAGSEQTRFARFVIGVLRFYERITLKKPDQELSNFDYYVYLCTIHVGQVLKGKPLGMWQTEWENVKRASRWKKEENSDEKFAISQIINTIGIIKFLKLDNDKRVEQLNKKYRNKEQGIHLLIRLLEEEYRRRYNRNK